LSIVAEFANELFNKGHQQYSRVLTPINYPAQVEKIYDIKAVIFDVYGTLINYWRTEFSDKEQKEKILLAAFKKTAEYFSFTDYIHEMNPADSLERTLQDFYHGLIALNHEKSLKKGVESPEVRIEEVWEVIIMMLCRHGYDVSRHGSGDKRELARCMAYYYNFHSLAGKFYDGVVDALLRLQKGNMKVGIVSDAQFYTPIDLTLLTRQQSNNMLDDYLELFDVDLIFYSYEYGMTKANPMLFQKLYDALYEYQILPSQTVFVGNDLFLDVKPAADIGMCTAFFTGDDKSAFVHDTGGEIIPDIVFEAWDELPDKISFYEKRKG
jgi:putative hydrolase of the HAD superfamily